MHYDNIDDVKKNINFYLVSKNYKKKQKMIRKYKDKFIINSGKIAKKEMIKKIHHITFKDKTNYEKFI